MKEEPTNEQIILSCIKKDRPEQLCGVYLLIKKDTIVYIGKSVDVDRRVRMHCEDRSKDFDYYLFLPCKERDIDYLECDLIKRFLPILNRDFVTKHQKLKIIKTKLDGNPNKTTREKLWLHKLENSTYRQRLNFISTIEGAFLSDLSRLKPTNTENANS